MPTADQRVLAPVVLNRFGSRGNGGGDGCVIDVDTVGASLCAAGTQLPIDSLVSTPAHLSLLLPLQNERSSLINTVE